MVIMPVARNVKEAPEWNRFSGFGVAKISDATGFDRHFHDADEYWLIYKGKAIVESEGKENEVGPGDVLFTKMGDWHSIVRILEPIELFWIEDALKGKKRAGHLHEEDL